MRRGSLTRDVFLFSVGLVCGWYLYERAARKNGGFSHLGQQLDRAINSTTRTLNPQPAPTLKDYLSDTYDVVSTPFYALWTEFASFMHSTFPSSDLDLK